MLIRALCRIHGTGVHVHEIGDEFELAPDLAAHHVARGNAELVAPPEPAPTAPARVVDVAPATSITDVLGERRRRRGAPVRDAS